MAVLLRTLRSAALSAGQAAALVAGVGLLGLALNWALLLLAARGGVLSSGFLILVFGIGFPIGWLLAAQPWAVGRVTRRLYRLHRDEVLGIVAAALRREVGEEADPSPERWFEALDGIRNHVEHYPRPVRPLLRLALQRAGIGAVEGALRTGSGPAPVRIAAAIADRIEQNLAGSGALWLGIVMGINLLAWAGAYVLISRS